MGSRGFFVGVTPALGSWTLEQFMTVPLTRSATVSASAQTIATHRTPERRPVCTRCGGYFFPCLPKQIFGRCPENRKSVHLNQHISGSWRQQALLGFTKQKDLRSRSSTKASHREGSRGEWPGYLCPMNSFVGLKYICPSCGRRIIGGFVYLSYTL